MKESADRRSDSGADVFYVDFRARGRVASADHIAPLSLAPLGHIDVGLEPDTSAKREPGKLRQALERLAAATRPAVEAVTGLALLAYEIARDRVGRVMCADRDDFEDDLPTFESAANEPPQKSEEPEPPPPPTAA